MTYPVIWHQKKSVIKTCSDHSETVILASVPAIFPALNYFPLLTFLFLSSWILGVRREREAVMAQIDTPKLAAVLSACLCVQ